MTALDHATQTEIRLANMYALYMETAQLGEINGRSLADGAHVARLEAMWSRNDRFMESLRSVAQDQDLDLALIFDVAREIRESETAR